MPGGYSEAAYAALRGDLTFVTEARVVTDAGVLVTPLSITGGSLTMDEEWAPYVQATVEVVDPGVLIEPRRAQRLVIDAGYVYPDGSRDVRQFATLVITDAPVDERTGIVTITAKSDEALVQDGAHWGVADDVQNYANHGAAMRNFVERALTGLTTSVWTGPGMPSTSASMTGYRIRSGDGWWQHVQSVEDMGGGVIYCNEARQWYVGPYQTDESPTTEGYIATGDVPESWPTALDAGRTLPILIEAETVRTRDEWANAVVLLHEWTDAGTNTPRRVAAIASVGSGDYRPTLVGYSVEKVDRDVPITQAEAQAAANAIVYRTQRRGLRRLFQARACWWLRPRNLHQVWVKGTAGYARITRCTWQLDGTGLMTILTRAPEPEAI